MTIKMKILLLDNYDSFTYNLLHAVKELGATDVELSLIHISEPTRPEP